MGIGRQILITSLTGVTLISWEISGLVSQGLTTSPWPTIFFPFFGLLFFACSVTLIFILDSSSPSQNHQDLAGPDQQQQQEQQQKQARRLPSPDPFKIEELPAEPSASDHSWNPTTFIQSCSSAMTEQISDLTVGVTCFASACVAILVSSFFLNAFASLFMRCALHPPPPPPSPNSTSLLHLIP